MALDQSVRKEAVKNIIKFENKINHFYLDSLGKVTIGIGHLIPNKKAVSSLVMYTIVNKVPLAIASLQEKQTEYDMILKQKKGYGAHWYLKYTMLIMKDADIKALLNKNVNTFYKELRTLYTRSHGYFDDFDNLDTNIQTALLDMIFNLGAKKIVTKFPAFNVAMKHGDWRKAAMECNRPQLNAKRNTYVRSKFLLAANKAIGVDRETD